jgi:hypothetical protein
MLHLANSNVTEYFKTVPLALGDLGILRNRNFIAGLGAARVRHPEKAPDAKTSLESRFPA